MKTTRKQIHLTAACAVICALAAATAHAQNNSADARLTLAPAGATASGADDAAGDQQAQQAELAKKLQNPVASLISVPIQNNWDFGIGPAHAMKNTANIQPVVPVSISKDWNLIIRTIMPVIYAESPVAGGGDKAGLGDITQSFFLSPKAPVGGWIIGAGPVGFYPAATEDTLGAGKWGAGPTIVALQQRHGFTYGILANQIWSFAGHSDRQRVNALYLQPFLTFTTKTFTSFSVNTETTYNWVTDESTAPMNFMVQQLLKIGKQPVALQFGYRYYVAKPSGGPNWGLRFAITFLFPKG